MTQYIDKNIVEEILRNLQKKDDGHNPEHRICYNKALQEVQCELDSIEVKEVDLEEVHYKPLDEDFERDAVSFCFDSGLNTTPHIAKTIAKHFFELGLKAQKGE